MGWVGRYLRQEVGVYYFCRGRTGLVSVRVGLVREPWRYGAWWRGYEDSGGLVVYGEIGLKGGEGAYKCVTWSSGV